MDRSEKIFILIIATAVAAWLYCEFRNNKPNPPLQAFTPEPPDEIILGMSRTPEPTTRDWNHGGPDPLHPPGETSILPETAMQSQSP